MIQANPKLFLTVPCTECGAVVGKACRSTTLYPHRPRYDAAMDLLHGKRVAHRAGGSRAREVAFDLVNRSPSSKRRVAQMIPAVHLPIPALPSVIVDHSVYK